MMENYDGNCENSQCQDFHNNSKDGQLKKILTNLQFPDFSVLKEIVINVTDNSLLIVFQGNLNSPQILMLFAFANHIFLKGFFTSETLFQFGANIQILLDLSKSK